MEIVNEKYLSPEGRARLREQFDQALPYRHLVMDNFLEPSFAELLYAQFPSIEALKIHWKGLNENKSEGSDFSAFAPEFQQLRNRLASDSMAAWVKDVTGIADAFITNDHQGAGLHQGSNGSFLDVHIDFNIHNGLDVHRRLNLLIYLQKDWQEEYGGHIELWNKDVSKLGQKVLPAFNRCVIFETSEISYHGYGKISVPEGVTRKSFFAYYYTKEREDAVPYHDTIFKARPEEGRMKKIKTDVKESLKNTAKSTLKKLGVKF